MTPMLWRTAWCRWQCAWEMVSVMRTMCGVLLGLLWGCMLAFFGVCPREKVSLVGTERLACSLAALAGG